MTVALKPQFTLWHKGTGPSAIRGATFFYDLEHGTHTVCIHEDRLSDDIQSKPHDSHLKEVEIRNYDVKQQALEALLES